MTSPLLPDDHRLSLLGHLEELRAVLLRCLMVVAAASAAALFFAPRLIGLLERPAAGLIQTFIVTRPAEIISVYVKVAVFAGVGVSLPVLVVLLWGFVLPALPAEGRPFVPAWSAAAAGLFAGGLWFAYSLLLPTALRFLVSMTVPAAQPMISVDSYCSFALAVLIAGGAVFEMPLLSGALARAGVITARLMRLRRREALFGMAVCAAIVTPTTDVVNLALFFAPMAVLYEVSIWSAVIAGRKRIPVEEVYTREN